MDLRHFRYASLVAKERSFTRAALRLDVAQSAVSEQIAKLEGELGFALFERSGRGIELTDLGRTFIAEADRILAEVQSLTGRVERLKNIRRETVRIGLGSGTAAVFVARLFPRIAQLFPELQIDILTATTKSVFDDLISGRVDLGIALQVAEERVPTGLKTDHLLDLPLAVITAPDHPTLGDGMRVDVADIAAEPLIMYELPVGYGEIVRSIFSDAGVFPSSAMLADNIETIKAIVGQGTGIAIMPAVAADLEVRLGLLKSYTLLPSRHVPFALYRRRHLVSEQREQYFKGIQEALQMAPEAERWPPIGKTDRLIAPPSLLASQPEG
jgi:DNA-binding transcriptional LysR family regulator